MYKPNGYDQAPSYDSDFQRLKAGGYVCEIKDAQEVSGIGKDGKPYRRLDVLFDICEGEFANYFTRQYKANKLRNKEERKTFWNGRYSIFFEDEKKMATGQYKGFLTSVENSNQGFKVNWSVGYEQLKGKKVGLLFREEEYESQMDGSVKTRVAACMSRWADCIRNGEFEIPPKKVLPARKSMTAEYNGFTETNIDDMELPF